MHHIKIKFTFGENGSFAQLIISQSRVINFIFIHFVTGFFHALTSVVMVTKDATLEYRRRAIYWRISFWFGDYGTNTIGGRQCGMWKGSKRKAINIWIFKYLKFPHSDYYHYLKLCDSWELIFVFLLKTLRCWTLKIDERRMRVMMLYSLKWSGNLKCFKISGKKS